LRAISHVLRAAIGIGIAVSAARGQYDAAVAFALVLPPALLAAAADAPARVELGFVAGLASYQWVNALGAAQALPELDVVAHLVLPFFTVQIAADWLERHGRFNGWAVNRAAGELTLGLALAWELVEYACDKVLDTNYSLGLADTVGDVAVGVLGVVLGLVFRPGCCNGRRKSPVSGAVAGSGD
jgi:hypothetical protein